MMPLRQALQNLLTDRAAGQLEPEVEALLHAYLEHDDAAKAEANVLDATVELARQSVALPRPVKLPAPRFAQRRSALPAWREWVPSLRFAAGAVAGMALGWFLAAAPWRDRSSSSMAQTKPVETQQATPSLAATGQNQKPSTATKNLYSVVWDSRESKPRIKNNL